MNLHESVRLWRWRFLAATGVLILLLSSLAILARHEQNARKSVADLDQLGVKLSLMRAATTDMKRVLAIYHSYVQPDDEHKTVEALLFVRLDEIKSLFPGSIFTIAPPIELSDGVSLSFSIKTTGSNYTDFINTLALMQSRTFPFVSVSTIAIGYDQPDKGIVGYKVEGTVKIPINGKRTGSP